MSVDEKFMKLAIELAKRSRQRIRCGAVIVKDGIVVSKASNYQRVNIDTTAHAEMKTIREAERRLGSKRLKGCTLYATCEPCTMCLSAMVFAKIKRLVFGVSLKDVSKELIDIDIDTFISKSPHKIEVVKNFMEAECKRVS